MPPATAAPEAPTATNAVGDLREQLRQLEHAVSFALPALQAVHDDPCKPAQRALLADVIDDLRAAVTTTGTLP